MTIDRDVTLVETVRTRRTRLVAAFLHGELDERRPTNDNLRRFAASLVIAAFACVGCIAWAVVTSYLAAQSARGR
ncbi:MAG: hypothetical protein ACRCZP_17085 [Phycicoccus sp.]